MTGPPASAPRTVRVFPDLPAMSRAAAQALVAAAQDAVSRTGRCTLALAGGHTPRTLYRLLADDYRSAIPQRLEVFWGDERYVPFDDPRSNYGMAKAVLLDRVPIPPDRIHPMPTHYPDAEQAARAYEEILTARFPGRWPRLDVVLLGLAADGHTASLFPGSPALAVTDRAVVAVRVPAEPPVRLTLTLPVFNHAALVFFLVAGAGKARALARALGGRPDPRESPAAAIRPVDGRVVWWVDEAAAAQLDPAIRAVAPAD